MLIDSKGRVFTAELPRKREAREAVLATLREVPTPTRPFHSDFFKVQKRARLTEARR